MVIAMIIRLDGRKLSNAMRQLEASKTPEEHRAAFLKASEAIEERAGELLRRSKQLLKQAESSMAGKENAR